MAERPHIVVEEDVFTRVLGVVLDPDTSAERLAAFADFFAHDVPDFDGWMRELRSRCAKLAPARVTHVDSADALRRELPTADAVVVESLAIGERELELAPRLKAVQKYGFVTRAIDAAACARRGVELLTLRRRANIACAEQAMMLILALAKRLPEVQGLTTTKRLQGAGFHPKPFDRRHTPSSNWARIPGIGMLAGSTLGIIGFGEIGREIALRAHPFDMKIVYTQRTRLDAETERSLSAEYRELDTLLGESDWIVPQLPATPSTQNLLDAGRIARIKRGARIVNVSRAQCMERAPLVAALQSGALGGLGLDTLWTEPGEDDDALLGLPNVILTPHLAGSPRLNATADFEEMIAGLDRALSR
jgi:phosphoglycerate dehydrogenase-like enzyme